MKIIEDLLERAEVAYHEEVICDADCIQQSAGAETPLERISASKLMRISKALEEKGVRYWLAEPIRYNPQRKYKLWIEITRGDSPVWGISPVTS